MPLLRNMLLRIQRFLCRKLQLSNPEVLALMQEKRVFINDVPAVPNQIFSERDAIRLDQTILQEAKKFAYYALYKPRGIECTTNPEIPDNIISHLPDPNVFLVGRLDKDSEGLIFLTDDPKFYDAVIDSDSFHEKEYFVETDLPMPEELLQQLRNGMLVLGQQTRPCQVNSSSATSFHIVLTQGLNRQIRRMCYKLQRQVLTLRRIRIGDVYLGEMKPGECRRINVV